MAAPFRVGRYRIYGEIASGGMATVHFGRLDGSMGFVRVVAVKRPHPHYAKDADFAIMFMDEARLASRVRHPNVVSMLDVVHEGSELLLVMEYIHGITLAQALRLTAKPDLVPLGVVLRVAIDVLHGLHAAHVAVDENRHPLALVHRDVSPQNVLLGTDGLARLTDFGIAKATTRLQTTREGQVKGKPRYMAPEQISELEPSPRTDVYAAGVVLWEMLTGTALFSGSSDVGIIAKVLEGVITPPSRIAARCPTVLDDIVMKALARDVGARFESAEAMAHALEATGLAGTSSALASWLQAIAREPLHDLAEAVAAIEGASETDDEAEAIPSPGEPVTMTGAPIAAVPRPRASGAMERPPDDGTGVGSMSTRPVHTPSHSRWWVLAAGVVVAVGVSILVLSRHRAPSVGALPTPPPMSASASPPPPLASVVVTELTPSVVASAIALPVTRLPSGPVKRVPAASTHPKCDKLYYEDPTGIRRVKPECL